MKTIPRLRAPCPVFKLRQFPVLCAMVFDKEWPKVNWDAFRLRCRVTTGEETP
jgi:hypothetical protein